MRVQRRLGTNERGTEGVVSHYEITCDEKVVLVIHLYTYCLIVTEIFNTLNGDMAIVF